MRRFIRFLIPAAVVFLVWLAWPYFQSDKSQLLRQHARLLAYASDREWESVKGCMSAEYEDQWGSYPAESVGHAEEIFRGFITLEMEWTTAEISLNGEIAKIRGSIKMTGRGLGISEMVMNQVNHLTEPWVFTWRREGRGPSGWKLLSVRNTGLGGALPDDLSPP